MLANVELSWLAPSKLRRTVIVGSEKMVVYEDGTPEPMRVFDSGVVYKDPETFGEYQLSYRTGDIVSPSVDSAEPLMAELERLPRRGTERGAPSRLARSRSTWSRPSRPPTSLRERRRGGHLGESRGPQRSRE